MDWDLAILVVDGVDLLTHEGHQRYGGNFFTKKKLVYRMKNWADRFLDNVLNLETSFFRQGAGDKNKNVIHEVTLSEGVTTGDVVKENCSTLRVDNRTSAKAGRWNDEDRIVELGVGFGIRGNITVQITQTEQVYVIILENFPMWELIPFEEDWGGIVGHGGKKDWPVVHNGGVLEVWDEDSDFPDV